MCRDGFGYVVLQFGEAVEAAVRKLEGVVVCVDRRNDVIAVEVDLLDGERYHRVYPHSCDFFHPDRVIGQMRAPRRRGRGRYPAIPDRGSLDSRHIVDEILQVAAKEQKCHTSFQLQSKGGGVGLLMT